ncbi:LUD domain-containing protein [Nevskia sp.]|uniref:LutC/YkgG family protein n=1 Tax=Nevskia sp. TaxID=1929292 RepID=UPI0025CF6683|nr:LUD domain-containing protein [Nevskia sp.]
MSASAESLRARSAIFERLRAATRDPQNTPLDVSAALLPLLADPVGETRTERFIRHARSWRAEVIETTQADWPEALQALLRARAPRQLFAGPGSEIAATLAACVPPQQLRWFDREIAALKPELFAADAGITTTLGGLAASGSLLVMPTIAEPRTLSLVPPLHIALLHESQLQDSLLSAMWHYGWASAMPSNLLTITGPSKTADIQRMLVYGAHGPRELVILLVQDGVRS